MLSDMSLTAVLRRMKVDAVPHGFRSSFRDWCAERTNYPREVAEMSLAHAIGDKVEAAYRRGDLFEKRRRLMKDWAVFCANPEIRKGRVISMNTSRR
jgi:integrase